MTPMFLLSSWELCQNIFFIIFVHIFSVVQCNLPSHRATTTHYSQHGALIWLLSCLLHHAVVIFQLTHTLHMIMICYQTGERRPSLATRLTAAWHLIAAFLYVLSLPSVNAIVWRMIWTIFPGEVNPKPSKTVWTESEKKNSLSEIMKCSGMHEEESCGNQIPHFKPAIIMWSES